MKNLRYLLPAMLFLSSLFACVEDEGNYVYDEEASHVIRFDTIGIENRLVLTYNLTPGQHVEFEPNVTYAFPERLRYRWFTISTRYNVYEPTQVGNALVYAPADTIGYEKKLDWIVDLAPGTYRFFLMAEDTINGTRGYYQAQASYCTVKEEGALTGLYMLSEYDGETDIDVHCSSAMMICGNEDHPRYYSGLTGNTLPGKPRFIRGASDGTKSKKAYIVCTDQNMWRLNKVKLQMMDEWSTMFYNTPATFNPQAMVYNNNCEYLLNDGKLHTLYTDMPNSRKYSSPIAGDYEAASFLTFKKGKGGSIGAEQMIYDEKNNCFRPYYSKRSSISALNRTAAGAIVDANSLPADPVVILNAMENRTYAIIELDGVRYLYRYDFYSKKDEGDFSADGSRSLISLENCKDINLAKYYASNTAGPSTTMNHPAHAFYYATDKAVYSYSPVKQGKDESYTLYECSANEEVTAIYAYGSIGGGWPSSDCLLWVAVWDNVKQEGKLIEYEMNHTLGEPGTMYNWMGMFGMSNPTVTTGWGKIRCMNFIDAE